jgi:hypothetical protein
VTSGEDPGGFLGIGMSDNGLKLIKDLPSGYLT